MIIATFDISGEIMRNYADHSDLQFTLFQITICNMALPDMLGCRGIVTPI